MFCVSLAWNAGKQIVTLSEEGQIQGGLYRAVDMPLGSSEILQNLRKWIEQFVIGRSLPKPGETVELK